MSHYIDISAENLDPADPRRTLREQRRAGVTDQFRGFDEVQVRSIRLVEKGATFKWPWHPKIVDIPYEQYIRTEAMPDHMRYCVEWPDGFRTAVPMTWRRR